MVCKISVENVPGERDPRVAHEVEEVCEVIESRVRHIEARREVEQLVQRLERLNDGVIHRKEHHDSE
jgi:transcriptional regulator of NAD metabolism